MPKHTVNLNHPRWNKVFEIGIQRTGTSSLGEAFRILNLKTKGWDETLYWQCIRSGYEQSVKTVKEYDAFEDLPWNFDGFYKILDKNFTNSKFIVLERELDDWTKSYCRAFPGEDPEFIKSWKTRKYNDIYMYFSKRPDDLLVMNLVDGDGWEVLCPFLDLPIPAENFPHKNKRIAN